jgi:hypothetical protein
MRNLAVVRRFLHEVCLAGDDDLGKISQEEVIRYIERHAQDLSPGTGSCHEAARTPSKALAWNGRTVPMLRETVEWGVPARPEVPMQGTGAEQPVVVPS